MVLRTTNRLPSRETKSVSSSCRLHDLEGNGIVVHLKHFVDSPLLNYRVTPAYIVTEYAETFTSFLATISAPTKFIYCSTFKYCLFGCNR